MFPSGGISSVNRCGLVESRVFASGGLISSTNFEMFIVDGFDKDNMISLSTVEESSSIVL